MDVKTDLPGGWQLFYRPESQSMNLRTSDPGFWLQKETGPSHGLWYVASCNLKSADYNPGNFNRMLQRLQAALGMEGWPHDVPVPHPAPLKSRHLRKRQQLLDEE